MVVFKPSNVIQIIVLLESPRRTGGYKGLNPTLKSKRTELYLKGFRKELLSLAHSCGYEHPSQFNGRDIEISLGMNKFTTLEDQLGYKRDDRKFTRMADYSNFPSRG